MRRLAFHAGAVLHGLVFGLLLFLALWALLETTGGARVFRYQGF